MHDEINEIIVSGTTLANIFGLTDRRVRQLDELGAIEKVKRGQYSLVNSIKKYKISEFQMNGNTHHCSVSLIDPPLNAFRTVDQNIHILRPVYQKLNPKYP